MSHRKQVLGPDDVRRAVTRMAHEVIERNRGVDGVVLLGMQRGGVWLAQLLGSEIARIAAPVPIGTVDVSLHRDDIGLRPVSPGTSSDVPVEVQGATVVLVDDVLYTGRTVRAALDAVSDFGRPQAIQLAVLTSDSMMMTPSGVTSTSSSELVGRFFPMKSGRIGSSR